MLTTITKKKIYIASNSVDFRQSIDGLSTFVMSHKGSNIHDGSIYVFYNANKDKIKCLFWDNNGFVLYYKRLYNCKFKLKKMVKEIENISVEELEILLSGLEPIADGRKPLLLEQDNG